MSGRRLLRTASWLAAASCGTLVAEAPAETGSDPEAEAKHGVLPESVIRAKRPAPAAGTPTSPTFDEVSARAPAVPGAVSVEAASSYRVGRAATLQDMLQFSPGVYVQARSGQESFRLSIRGSGAQRTIGSRGIAVMQDGLPLNNADGSFAVEMLDPAAFSRVEIRRGASAWRSGAGALGGSIDFVNHTGIDGPSARLSGEAGLYGYARGSATGSLRDNAAAPGTDAIATVTGSTSDGWRDATESRALRANANVGQRVGTTGENRFYLGYMALESELPGALTLAQLESDPRAAAPANRVNPSAMDADGVRLADRLAFVFDDARLEFAGGWQGREIDHPAGGTTSGTGNDDAFFKTNLDYLADLAGHRNRFGAGVTAVFGVTNGRSFVNPPGDARRGARVQDTDERATGIAVYADDDFYVARAFALTAATRLDYARRQRRINLATPGSLSFDDARTKEYFGVSPTVGGRYEWAGGKRQVYANVSRGYEAPAFLEFNTRRINVAETVDAQEATTVEIGTRGTAGPVSWDFAVYRSWLKNEFITYATPTPANPNATSTVNADDTGRFGVEAGMEADLLGGDPKKSSTKLLFRQTVAWTVCRFHDDAQFGNNVVAGIPAVALRTELLLRLESGWYLGPNVEYSESTYIDNRNTLKADGFALLGFRAGYRPGVKGWAAYVEARNLLEKRYSATSSVVVQAAPGGAYYNPGQGFTAFAGVEYTW